MAVYEGFGTLSKPAIKKKGQTELIGLMVIVLLLIFLGMVYIGFVSFKESSVLPTIRANIEAENALKSVMKVKIQDDVFYGGNMTIEELMVACSDDTSMCVVLEDALEEVYNVVLKPTEDFSFSFYTGDEKVYEFGVCGLGVVASYSFIKDYVFYEAKLKLCRD